VLHPPYFLKRLSNKQYYPFLSTWQYISIWAPGAFTFAAGKQGGGQGKSFLQNVFGLNLAVDFRSLRKSFFVQHNYCLLVREMISFRACRADSSAANPRIYMKGVKALASMAL